MSKKQEIQTANNLKRLLKYRSINNRRNCCKYWKGTTDQHFLVMCQICMKFAQNGWEFFTEAEGKDEKWRADIVAINGSVGQIIEILHSETEEKFLKKKSYYPKEFILRPISTKNFKLEDFDI